MRQRIFSLKPISYYDANRSLFRPSLRPCVRVQTPICCDLHALTTPTSITYVRSCLRL